MKISNREGPYAKIGTVAGVIGAIAGVIGAIAGVATLLWAILTWQLSRTDTSQPTTATTTEISPSTSDPGPRKKGPAPRSGQPKGDITSPPKPGPSCESPETATLGEGSPVTVASGLATLSVRAGQMGSEKLLTLGITSDRESRSEAVLGVPERYGFKTSQGSYFVNITQVDFEAATLRVEVGCESKGTNR